MNPQAFAKVFKNTLIVDLEYRFNYFMIILSSLVTLVMEWAIFSNVYVGKSDVGGLPVASAFAFILYGMILRTVQSVWGPIFTATEEIREGSFRRYLLQPIFHPAYFLAQVIGNKFTPILGALVICVAYKLGFDAPENFFRLAQVPYAVLAFVLSTLLLWLVYLLVVYAAFFLEESSFLTVSLNIAISLLSGSLLPLSWYPDEVRQVIAWTPLPLFGDWPLRAALGLLSESEQLRYLGSWSVWTGIALFLVVLFYRRGLQRYESFGG